MALPPTGGSAPANPATINPTGTVTLSGTSDKHKVTIASSSGNWQVTALLGTAPTKITGGFGGWDIVSRPRKRGLTEWKGNDPLQIQVNIVLDGWVGGPISIEDDLKQILWMALPIDQGNGQQDPPTTVVLMGPTIVFPIRGRKWVITNVDFADDTIWMMMGSKTGEGSEANRVRQSLTLSMTEFVDPDRIVIVGVTVGLSPKPRAPYEVKYGDTLVKLAVKWYGDPNMASAIADANNIRDTKKLPKFIRHIP